MLSYQMLKYLNMLVTRNFSEDSTLTLNDGVMSRQSCAKGQSTQSSAQSQPHQRKDTKYSKSRSPIMQSLNPTQLQPPSSILKASEVRSGNPTGAEQNSEQNSAAAKLAAGTTSSGDSTQWAF